MVQKRFTVDRLKKKLLYAIKSLKIMESQNCLMILIFIILGGYVIKLGGYVIIFGD